MFIPLEDAMVFATSFGQKEAPALLALSGWIGSWEDWVETFSPLSEDWRVVSYDHRGSGASIAKIESITFDNLVADVFTILDVYGIERCVLAAMSMGAAVALAAALKHPERFADLVIVNGLYLRQAPLENDPFYRGLNDKYAQMLDLFVNACVPENNSDHIKRWGRQILDRASPEAAIALYRMTDALDLRSQINQITVPALILHGDADSLVSLESSRWLAETLPNGRLVILPGAGHVPIMTRPDEVVEEIRSFFSTF